MRILPVLLLLLFTALNPACGIVTAPVTLPWALADNQPLHIRGTIVDDANQPLSDVLVEVSSEQTRWAWLEITATDTHTSHHMIPSNFSLRPLQSRDPNEWVRLRFVKSGHRPVELWVNHHNVALPVETVEEIDIGEEVKHPLGPNFVAYRHSQNGERTGSLYRQRDTLRPDNLHVILPRETPATLTSRHTSDAHMNIRTSTSAGIARLNNNILTREQVPILADALKTPNTIALDAPRDPNGRILVVPASTGSNRQPLRLKLIISGEGNGFIRKDLQPTPGVAAQMAAAPATGYGELLLTPMDLERLLKSPKQRLWFFVRIDNRFGRGYIHALKLDVDKNGPQNILAVDEVSLAFVLLLRDDGNRQLGANP